MISINFCLCLLQTGDCFFQEYLGQDKIVYVHVFNLFITLWLIQFIVALGQCTLAGSFAGWYWTRGSPGRFPLLKAFYRCIRCSRPNSFVYDSIFNQLFPNLAYCRYHIGSLAFGAFIIALIQLIRMILEYLDRKLKDKKSVFAEFIMK